MNDIIIQEANKSYIRVRCESGIAQELSEFFSFQIPGHKYMAKFKNGMWDGYIRLFNTRTHLLYSGLRQHVETFAEEREYSLGYVEDFSDDNFSEHEAKTFFESLEVPDIEIRDYQLEAFIHGVRKRRAVMLCPTGSGKSLIAYLLTRYLNLPTLIIVPTIGLVGQMYQDFQDYGFDSDTYVHKLHGGQDKVSDKKIVIATWQTVRNMPQKWLNQFRVVIGDEAHLFKAKELTGIMEKMTLCPYRFGLTGTLDGLQVNKLVLEGLFGPVRTIARTIDLINAKYLSDLAIKCIIFRYPDEIRQVLSKTEYDIEKDYIITNAVRNKFIANLTLSLKGNTILFFTQVQKQGKILHQMIHDKGKDRKIFYVDGGVSGDDRNDIRSIVEKESNAIIVASTGTTSVGFNVRNIHNIIFANPSKSRIRTLQSIGRGLRIKTDDIDKCTLFDLADDFSWETKRSKKVNTTLKHFSERIKMYDSEEFNYTIYKVGLK